MKRSNSTVNNGWLTAWLLCIMMAAIILGGRSAAPVYAEDSPETVDLLYGGAKGTEDDPFLIRSAEELALFSQYVYGNRDYAGQYFRLTRDITLTGEWEPIGGDTIRNEYTTFMGTFDGGGFTISGLFVPGDTGSNESEQQGLFGKSGGTIKNLTVKGSVTGGLYVGGIVGINEGTVINCRSECAVTGGDYVGGVVGRNQGTIENCRNTGTVSGSHNVGGIAGQNNKGRISGCYNTGSVSTLDGAGGIAEQNYNGTINRCYNTGSINGGNKVGGIVADNSGGSTISGCYNTGSLNASTKGGIAGSNSGSITNAYYLSDTDSGSGGVQGKTAGQFKSGEVAWLLQKEEKDSAVWGQNLGTDSGPAFRSEASPKVCKIAFHVKSAVYDVRYVNPGRIGSKMPEDPAEYDRNTEFFAGWRSGETGLTGDTVVNGDMEVDADFVGYNEPEGCSLTYSGGEQKLVRGGSVTDPSRAGLQYALSPDAKSEPDTYSDQIPAQTNAGTYCIWWRVASETRSTQPKSLLVTIKRAKVTEVGSIRHTAENGQSVLDIVGSLPKTVVLTAENAPPTTAKIRWNGYDGGYDPNALREQSFTVTGTLIPEDDANYDLNGHTTVTAEITTVRSESLTLLTGGEGRCMYGDTLTLKVNVRRSTENGIAPVSVGINKVRLTVNGLETKSANVTYDPAGGGTAVLTLAVNRANGFTVGENRIQARFGGNAALSAGVSEEFRVKVEARPLSYTLSAAETVRPYDGTKVVAVTAVPVDPVAGDSPKIVVTAELPQANAGIYDQVRVLSAVIEGDSADCYTLSIGEHDLENSVTIEKAMPKYTLPENLKIGQGEQLSVLLLPDGFTWKDGGRTCDIPGPQTFEAVYTPEDTTNYRSVNVNIPVMVVEAQTPTVIPKEQPVEPQEDLPEVSPGDPPEDWQEDLPEDWQEDLPGDWQEDPPEDWQEDLPGDWQEDLPGDWQEDLLEDWQENLPEDWQEDRQTDLPANWQRDLPGTPRMESAAPDPAVSSGKRDAAATNPTVSSDARETAKNPGTGDDSHPGRWIFLLSVSLTVLLAILLRSRRNRLYRLK